MESNFQSIQFSIIGLEILEHSIKSPEKVLPEQTAYRFDINIEHRLNTEKNKLFVAISVSIFCEFLQETLAFAKINCIYSVPDLKNFVKENGVFEIPQDFYITINSISLSTCRGVLFSLFRGTFLHNVMLPIIDPKSFVPSTE